MADEVDGFSKEVDDWMNRYHAFKLAFVQTEEGRRRDAWHLAVTSLVVRQVMNLDAIRATALAGRPHAGYILLRHSYEVYLQLLLLGYANGEIPKSKRNSKVRRWTRRRLAARFLRFVEHVRAQYAARFESRPGWFERGARLLRGSVADAMAFQARRQKRAGRIRRFHGWREETYDWLPFASIRDLRDYLWKPGAVSAIPSVARPKDHTSWLNLYEMAYRFPSHHVHGSAYAVLSNYSAAEGFLVDQQVRDPEPLRLGLVLAEWTLAAFAEAVGVPHLYRLVQR